MLPADQLDYNTLSKSPTTNWKTLRPTVSRVRFVSSHGRTGRSDGHSQTQINRS